MHQRIAHLVTSGDLVSSYGNFIRCFRHFPHNIIITDGSADKLLQSCSQKHEGKLEVYMAVALRRDGFRFPQCFSWRGAAWVAPSAWDFQVAIRTVAVFQAI